MFWQRSDGIWLEVSAIQVMLSQERCSNKERVLPDIMKICEPVHEFKSLHYEARSNSVLVPKLSSLSMCVDQSQSVVLLTFSKASARSFPAPF